MAFSQKRLEHFYFRKHTLRFNLFALIELGRFYKTEDRDFYSQNYSPTSDGILGPIT